MKKTIKIVTGLIVAVLVILLAFVLLKGCGSSKVDKSGFYSKDIKTSKTSSSSSKSSTKSSSKKSSSTSSSTQADSSTEATSNEASAASSATTTTPTQAQAQTPTQPSQGNSANQAGTTTSESDPKTGYGGWEATSGTLELLKDTPVYASPDKSSGVAYVQPQTNIEWDKYMYENGEWWYSFVQKNRDQEVRFYIAYSDIGY